MTGAPAAAPVAVSNRRPTLVAQLTVLSTVVAVLAVLVTFVVAFPLIRQSAEVQAQGQLSSQADLVADLVEAKSIATAGTRNQLPQLKSLLAAQKVDVSVVASVDQVPKLLTPADRAVLARGAPVSGVRTVAGRRYLVEARAAFPFAWVVLSKPASLARSNAESNGVRRLGVALGVGLLLAVAAGVLLARRLARPLVHVRAGAYRLSHGDRSVRVEPDGPREVAEVAGPCLLYTSDAADE